MHWRNSHFQIRHFLAGRAHTPDEAYRVLCELAEERESALEAAHASFLRTDARVQQLRAWWRQAACWFVPGLRSSTLADLMMLHHDSRRGLELVRVAQAELDYIRTLIAEVQPHRKFSHLPDAEAHQVAQAEQWRLELLWRIENNLVALGTIPPEQLEVMRLHPDWNSTLLPHIDRVRRLVSEGRVAELPAHVPVLIGSA